jgi:hypothetical protein
MRSYIVIPEGTEIVEVMASTPHYAVSKARRGKGTPINSKDTVVLPVSAAIASERQGRTPIPGEMSFFDDVGALEA